MEIESDRFITARDIFNNKKINHNNVSYGTVNNYLNKNGFKSHVAKKSLGLTPEHIENRLEWAIERVNYDL